MPNVTVHNISVQMKAYFTFKEPFHTYLAANYTLDAAATKLTVLSIISMKDQIKNDLRDPYSNIYLPATISEPDYKQDLIDNISIISLGFIDNRNVERTFRVPVNYIESISEVTNVEYLNKLILIDLNKLPDSLDLTVYINDIKTFIETRVGLIPEVKVISIGDIEMLTMEEHNTRETIRTNMTTVHKTTEIQLQELQTAYDELLFRLNSLLV